MKINQKGFSVVEILVVIVVVGLLGTVGWLVYDGQKSKTDSKDTIAQTNQQEQKQETETQEQKESTVKVDYTQWTKVTGEQFLENETARYRSKSGSGTLSVFSKEPIITYSSNAPVYCKYESDMWVHFSAIGSSTNTYKKDESSDACDSIKKMYISDFPTHTRYGGALGQTTFSAVIKNKTEWFAFEDYKNQDNVNLSDTEAKAIEDGLLKSVQDLVSKTLIKV